MFCPSGKGPRKSSLIEYESLKVKRTGRNVRGLALGHKGKARSVRVDSVLELDTNIGEPEITQASEDLFALHPVRKWFQSAGELYVQRFQVLISMQGVRKTGKFGLLMIRHPVRDSREIRNNGCIVVMSPHEELARREEELAFMHGARPFEQRSADGDAVEQGLGLLDVS